MVREIQLFNKFYSSRSPIAAESYSPVLHDYARFRFALDELKNPVLGRVRIPELFGTENELKLQKLQSEQQKYIEDARRRLFSVANGVDEYFFPKQHSSLACQWLGFAEALTPQIFFSTYDKRREARSNIEQETQEQGI